MRKKDKTKAPSHPLQTFCPGSTSILFFLNLLTLLFPSTPNGRVGWRMRGCSLCTAAPLCFFFLLTLSCCSSESPSPRAQSIKNIHRGCCSSFQEICPCGPSLSCMFLQGYMHRLWHREFHGLHRECLLHYILWAVWESLHLLPLLFSSRGLQGCFSHIFSSLSLSLLLCSFLIPFKICFCRSVTSMA